MATVPSMAQKTQMHCPEQRKAKAMLEAMLCKWSNAFASGLAPRQLFAAKFVCR
jgi:hypothetical protein